MLSLAEWFQAFHRYAVENELSANARALYYTLLGEFNAKFWKVDKVSISVRQVQALGGFQSTSIVDRAKTVLSTENIVKIQKLKNRKNQYELVEPEKWLRNTCGTPAEHLRDTSGTPAEHLRDTTYSNNTNNSCKEEDSKTIRPKDINNNKEKNAHAQDFNKVKDLKEDARAGYFGLSLEPELQEKWEKSTRNSNRTLDGKLTDYEFTRLAKLQDRYGVEKLKVAMDKALGYNNAGLNHLERSLEELSSKPKGEFRNGRSSNNVTAESRRNAWDD